MPYFTPRPLLALGGLLLAAASYGQAPRLTASTPARNGVVARTGALELTFSQAVTGPNGLRLFGSQWRGERAGALTGNGSATLRFQPTQAFAPGERLMLTVLGSITSTGGTALSGGGQVLGFRAAAGPGTGTFGGSTEYGLNATQVFTPTLADVNNDGKLDLLMASALPNGVDLRLGDGRGGFGGSTILATGGEPQNIVVADFNHDGNLDLAAGSTDGTYFLTISLGTGTGSFGASTRITADKPVMGLSTGDVNGDGNLDLVYAAVAPSPVGGNPASSTLTVLLGNGQGGFAPGATLALSPGITSVYLQDLNNDGYLDCVTGSGGNFLGTQGTGLLTSYLGNGQGTFAAATTGAPINAGINGVLAAEVADVTGDGVSDLLVPEDASGNIRLHPGTGQGDFGAATTTLPAAGTRQIVTADLNGDGSLDILALRGVQSGDLSIWLGNNGTYQASTLAATAYHNLAVGDLNGDGALDLLTRDLPRNSGFGTMLRVRLNQALASAPVISGFSPASGPAGTLVTLSGSNFASATAVLIGGVAVAFTVTPAGTITLAVPAGIPHGSITVISPTGAATSAQAFSLVLASRPAAAALPATVFPNPAHAAAQLQLPAGTGPLQLSLYNALGQLVRHARLTPAADGRLGLDLQGLAPAVYTLQLQSATQRSTQRLVVE